MNVSTTLMVLIMFTSIVGIGVGNILMTFSSTVASMDDPRQRTFGYAWLFILLMTFLSMFWNSVALAGKETWTYMTFIYVISGPIVLLFAASLATRLLQDGPDQPDEGLSQRIVARYFIIYAVSQLWFVGMDQLLHGEWRLGTTVSIAIAAAALIAAFGKSLKWQRTFTAIMVVLVLLDIVLQSW